MTSRVPLLLAALSLLGLGAAADASRLKISGDAIRVASASEREAAAAPAAPREFRGAWVASVANIDWPSKPGLSTQKQKEELIHLLDRCAQLRLNAVLLQVRPACDALYESKLEPWSEYLTGQSGRAPSPYYDPLTFAVTEAHRRGLELHAWFNPYRARHQTATTALAANHVARTKPHLVKEYGNLLWMDPGAPETMEHSLAVVRDVVARYDVDGVHIDDYFYPYKVKGPNGANLDFPDDASYAAYKAGGGQLSRDDWRRWCVDTFIRRMYEVVKEEKPWVKVGISPFGIWRPGYPPQIKGFDAYAELYGDARKWMKEGWGDYFSPQLYWPINREAQSFPVLLKWWVEQNAHQRHVWPGQFTSQVPDSKWPTSEITDQIQVIRKTRGSTGHVHFSAKTVVHNRAGMADALAKTSYTRAALVPASPWLDNTPPPRPYLGASRDEATRRVRLVWSPEPGNGVPSEPVWQWVLNARINGVWRTEILPARKTTMLISDDPQRVPDLVTVSAVDRTGNESPRAALRLTVN